MNEAEIQPPTDAKVDANEMMQQIQALHDHYQTLVVEKQREALGAGVLGGMAVTAGFIIIAYLGYTVIRKLTAPASSAMLHSWH